MNTWINYHHLLYFKIIAEEESVSRAAQKLRLGQPTLSTQLKQFEDALGVPLFERRHKKLVLTEQGRIALEYARNIFSMGNELYEVLHDRLVPSRVHLQIGALDSVPKQVILQISKFAYKESNCKISLIEGKFNELLRELLSHRIDLFVSNYLPLGQEDKKIFHKSLVKKPISLFASPRLKKLKKDFPKSVSGQKFILPTFDSKLRHDVEHWAKLQEISLDIIAETQDVSLKKMMAIEGLGLIPAAPYDVQRQVQGGELTEIGKLNGVYEELFIISAERKIINPLAAKILKSFHV